MSIPLDIQGKKFGRLTPVSKVRIPSKYRKNGTAGWVCRCKCGGFIDVLTVSLTKGIVRSCGCLVSETTIAKNKARKKPYKTNTPTYISWKSMKARCLNKNATSYEYYGAKGVTICDKWLTYQNFLNDMGERPDGMTIDRIDAFGNYKPSNCKWSTRLEQNQNKTNAVKYKVNKNEA